MRPFLALSTFLSNIIFCEQIPKRHKPEQEQQSGPQHHLGIMAVAAAAAAAASSIEPPSNARRTAGVSAEISISPGQGSRPRPRAPGGIEVRYMLFCLFVLDSLAINFWLCSFYHTAHCESRITSCPPTPTFGAAGSRRASS